MIEKVSTSINEDNTNFQFQVLAVYLVLLSFQSSFEILVSRLAILNLDLSLFGSCALCPHLQQWKDCPQTLTLECVNIVQLKGAAL
jgi:hypothetical protein